MDLPILYSKSSWQDRRKAREEYIRLQEGKCYHCGSYLNEPPHNSVIRYKLDMRRFPKDFLKHPVHLHHCHISDKTIGAVHAHCNGVLWQYFGE